MLSKHLNVDPPPPPRDRPEVLNQPVGIFCPAMMTTATSRMSSKTTTPTHHLAAAHTPRPAVALSAPWLIYFRMLCLSTPCLLLLRDSTSNRKSSLPKANISFSQSAVALVPFCTLRSEPRLTQRTTVDRTRLVCQRRQCFWETSCTCWSHDQPHDPEGLLYKLCTSFSCLRYQ